jgi:hypothetical protein
LFDPLIEGLQHTRVHRRDHIHRGIQLFFRHPRFPCVRKAAIHSWIAQPHYCHRKTHEHLLALAQTFDGVGVFIECPEIGFIRGHLFYFLFISFLIIQKCALTPALSPRNRRG